jgi:hypothetical protein
MTFEEAIIARLKTATSLPVYADETPETPGTEFCIMSVVSETEDQTFQQSSKPMKTTSIDVTVVTKLKSRALAVKELIVASFRNLSGNIGVVVKGAMKTGRSSDVVKSDSGQIEYFTEYLEFEIAWEEV